MDRFSMRPTQVYPALAAALPRQMSPEERLLYERLTGLKDAMEILRAVQAPEKELRRAATKMQSVEEQFKALAEIEGPKRPARVDALAGTVEAAEEDLLRADAKVPMDLFREHFDEKALAFTALARFTRLLASRPLGGGERRDRFEFLATRLLWLKSEDGAVHIRSRTKADPVLHFILPVEGPALTEEARHAAVSFFQSAARQLGQFETVDALLGSGFYLDVYGYKVALRDDLLDADVLYAAVVLNVAIAARIHEILKKVPARNTEIEVKLVEQEREVHRVFAVPEDAPGDPEAGRASSTPPDEAETEAAVRSHFRRERKNARARRSRAARVPLLTKQNVSRGFMVLLILVGLVGVGLIHFRDENRLVALPAHELARLSGLLEEGAFSRGRSERVFYGKFVTTRWVLLSPVDRRRAAESLRDKLDARSVRAALVQAGGQLVIHIDRSELMSIQ